MCDNANVVENKKSSQLFLYKKKVCVWIRMKKGPLFSIYTHIIHT